jgi:phospholipase B1
MKSNPNIDYANDWKVLTLFIGANNLCRACDPSQSIYSDAKDFEKSLTEVINLLTPIPRLFVNLVSIFNISGVYNVSLRSEYCTMVHMAIGFSECECAFSLTEGQVWRDKMDLIASEYRRVVREVAKNAPKTDSFAVVVQPFLEDMVIPGLDYLSTLDCFHPSLQTHQLMALALWNTMLTPAAKKKTSYYWPVNIICPTNDTLLYTY